MKKPKHTPDRATLGLIEHVGRLIHGDAAWIESIMSDIGYSRVTWHRWSKGNSPTPTIADVLPKLLEAMGLAIDQHVGAAKKIDAERRSLMRRL
jgi:hypothetical protein